MAALACAKMLIRLKIDVQNMQVAGRSRCSAVGRGQGPTSARKRNCILHAVMAQHHFIFVVRSKPSYSLTDRRRSVSVHRESLGLLLWYRS